MLLEYTEETKDDDLGGRAIEIRRRVGRRRLQRAIDEGTFGSEALLSAKQQSRSLLTTFRRDNLQVTESMIASRVALRRSDQHLRVVSAFRQADRELSRIQVLGKAKIDTLSDLETRIQLMRNRLKSGDTPTVEEDMQREVRMNGRAGFDRMFTQCPRCQQRILSHMVTTHEGACKRVEEKVPSTDSLGTVSKDFMEEMTTFLPQPPRNFRVINKGCTFIHWGWDPPVMEGGMPVIDYEMRYRCHVSEVDEFTGRTKSYTAAKDPFKTSIWCLNRPIARSGYSINGLLAGCEYFDFEIRSQNHKGFSAWVAMEDVSHGTSVCTEDPDPPTAPLRFQITRITSSCIHLRWDPPFFDGGRIISGYVVSYVVLERDMNSHNSEIFHEKPNAFKVDKEAST